MLPEPDNLILLREQRAGVVVVVGESGSRALLPEPVDAAGTVTGLTPMG